MVFDLDRGPLAGGVILLQAVLDFRRVSWPCCSSCVEVVKDFGAKNAMRVGIFLAARYLYLCSMRNTILFAVGNGGEIFFSRFYDSDGGLEEGRSKGFDRRPDNL